MEEACIVQIVELAQLVQLGNQWQLHHMEEACFVQNVELALVSAIEKSAAISPR
jgi:hypothetical protein